MWRLRFVELVGGCEGFEGGMEEEGKVAEVEERVDGDAGEERKARWQNSKNRFFILPTRCA